MLFKTLLIIGAIIHLQTAFAKQRNWSFKNPLYETNIAKQFKQNVRQTAQHKLHFKKYNNYHKGWHSPELSYLSVSQPTEHNSEEVSSSSSSDNEQSNHKLAPTLPWCVLQGTLQYRLSEDVYIQGAGLVYLSRSESNGTQFTPAESSPEKSTEPQDLPSTPPKMSISSDHCFSPGMQSLYRNAWADKDSLISATQSIASFQSKAQSVVSHASEAKQSFHRRASTSPSPVREPLEPINNNSKQCVGVGGAIASQHTFLNPHPNCLFYWSPSMMLLYPVNYDASPLISLSIGMGIRWKMNSKITIDAAGTKTLKTWGVNQELRFLKLGFRYNTG